jgi:VanZ family protein
VTAKSNLIIYTSFIVTVFILAYLNLLPLQFINASWFDSAGHFILYGLWGYFFGRAFSKTLFKIGKFRIPIGIAIATAIAIAEELLQSFSPYRSFTFSDMAFSVAGIVAAAVILQFCHDQRVSE